MTKIDIGIRLPPKSSRIWDSLYIVLFWTDTGWVRYFSRYPIRSPDDLRKVKLLAWSADSDNIDLVKEAGFNPVALEATDIVTGLQTGLIDALACPPYYALASQIYSSANYMVDVNWAPLVGAFVITKRSWEKIPESLRPAFIEVAKKAGKAMKENARRESNSSVDAMVEKWGLKVHQVSPEENAQWIQVAERLYPKIRGRMVPAEIFDEVVALLSDRREQYQMAAGDAQTQ